MTAAGRGPRRAFTVIEMIVAIVILGIVGASLIRILVLQTHLFQKAAAQRETRVVARSARNVVDSDLRMLEAANGIVSATSTSLLVRSPYAMGVVCGASGSSTIVSVAPVDSAVWAAAGFSGYAWRDGSGAYTYVETNASVTAAASAAVCTAASITTLPNGRVVSLAPVLPVAAVPGTPVLFEQRLRYEFKASVMVPGATGLWRTTVSGGGIDDDANSEELVAPFTGSAHFKFFVLNSDTSQAAVPSPVSNIRGIEFVLSARSTNAPAGQAAPESTQVNTAVFFRNRLN
jgi:prepilin-type N-terminal cleavage/methylation domain-containing protein